MSIESDIIFGNINECSISVENGRSVCYRGLDFAGYIPGVGSITGSVRIIVSLALLTFYTATDLRYSKSMMESRVKNLSNEVKRGIVELIPAASIIHDFIVSLTQNKKDENNEPLIAYGNYWHVKITSNTEQKQKDDFSINYALTYSWKGF